MRHLFSISLAVLTCATPSHAQPMIRPNSIWNAASRLTPGLPNYGIAQGSLFIVRGSFLTSGMPFTLASSPLPMTLAGASMQITVAGSAVNVPVVYAARNMRDFKGNYDELAGIVPSSTATGSGTLTVTVNGQSSAPAPITIVAAAFGIFTLNQSGFGPGVFTSTDFTLNSLADVTRLFAPDATYGGKTLVSAANPGDQLVIWGTGLGPISGDDAAPPPAGAVNAPVEVYVGNVKADVTSQGRASCCNGIDQIQITVPAGVTGCYVPVAVKIGASSATSPRYPLRPTAASVPTRPASPLPTSRMRRTVRPRPSRMSHWCG